MESTAQLLRPHQMEQVREDIKRFERTLNAPDHVRAQVQSPNEMRRQLRASREMLDKQAPKPFAADELDKAVAREKELLTSITNGMPTQQEMRRNPNGAVDKHRLWEKRNKSDILRWKNLRLRLHESGAVDGFTKDSGEVANLEHFRPSGGPQELLMHGEQIPGTDYHMVANPRSVTMNDTEIAALKEVDPEMAGMLATMSAESRAVVKEAIQLALMESAEPKAKGK